MYLWLSRVWQKTFSSKWITFVWIIIVGRRRRETWTIPNPTNGIMTGRNRFLPRSYQSQIEGKVPVVGVVGGCPIAQFVLADFHSKSSHPWVLVAIGSLAVLLKYVPYVEGSFIIEIWKRSPHLHDLPLLSVVVFKTEIREESLGDEWWIQGWSWWGYCWWPHSRRRRRRRRRVEW